MIFSTPFKIIPDSVGVDMSDRAIKMVKLTREGKHFSHIEVKEKAVPAGVLEEGIIHSPKELAKVLRDTVEKNIYVSCSLPEQHTYLRVVQVPVMSEEELKEAIQWEVEANIPLSLSGVYFDWEVIRSSLSSASYQKNGKVSKRAGVKKKDHLDILVSALPRELIDSYVSLFELSGLKLFSLTPESIALARSVINKDKIKSPVMIIDIGLTHTLFVIYARNSVRFASSTPAISGSFMNQAIERSLKVSAKKAEKLKKSASLSRKEDKDVIDALTPTLSALREQAKEYINFYQEHGEHTHDNASISKIVLSGGDSLLGGLDEHMKNFLNIPVERAKPLDNILGKAAASNKISDDLSMRYATAIGLAMTDLRSVI